MHEAGRRSRGNLHLWLCALAFMLCATPLLAQTPPPFSAYGSNIALNYWSFDGDNYWNPLLNSAAPLACTNIVNASGGNGNTLLLDSTNAAFFKYLVTETNDSRNLTVDRGAVAFWFRPSWSSTNQGGSGPGDWGRFLEVGAYTTNASYGWWSLYLDPQGTNIYFSSQTNNGSGSVNLSAPIAWISNVWHSLVLNYSPTNTALFLDGALAATGSGVAYRPGPSVLANGFSVGSASNGFAQARGQFDDLATYRDQVDTNGINQSFNVFAFIYYGISFSSFVGSAPYSPSSSPNYDVVAGSGWLTNAVASGTCVTNGRIYFTNMVATRATNGSTTVSFSIAGGTNKVPYDVFTTPALKGSNVAEAQWYWVGQGYTCTNYTVSNQPAGGSFYVLAVPLDSDHDGLTDAYERLVSKTDPTKVDTDNDGIPEAWAVLQGLDPLLSGFATLDPDFDALLNLHEYRYGTRPQVSEGFDIWVVNPSAGIP